MSGTGTILLVIPAFRESARLGTWLDELLPVLQKVGGIEVLVVDDGSDSEESGRMLRQVEERKRDNPLLRDLLILPENKGKGGAIKAGWEQATGQFAWLGFTDADGAVPASEVSRMIEAVRHEPATAHFASRVKMLGRTIERSLHRHLVGRIFATLVSEVLDIEVYDSQCGLKFVPASSYRKICGRLREDGFAFDVDLLVALLDGGEAVVEFPVDWRDVAGSKVHLLRDSLRMAQAVRAIHQRRRPFASPKTP